VVASGRLAQISQLPPEIVLIDMAMPGLSGVEALPRILALAPGAAVIMVSGAGDNEIAGRTRALGAVDFLVKPFDFSRLNETLDTALEQRRSDARSPR
jgi:DNA-binding NtrC family response regulator